MFNILTHTCRVDDSSVGKVRRDGYIIRNVSNGPLATFDMELNPRMYSSFHRTGLFPLTFGYGDPDYTRGRNEFDRQLRTEAAYRSHHQEPLMMDCQRRRLIEELMALEGKQIDFTEAHCSRTGGESQKSVTEKPQKKSLRLVGPKTFCPTTQHDLEVLPLETPSFPRVADGIQRRCVESAADTVGGMHLHTKFNSLCDHGATPSVESSTVRQQLTCFPKRQRRQNSASGIACPSRRHLRDGPPRERQRQISVAYSGSSFLSSRSCGGGTHRMSASSASPGIGMVATQELLHSRTISHPQSSLKPPRHDKPVQKASILARPSLSHYTRMATSRNTLRRAQSQRHYVPMPSSSADAESRGTSLTFHERRKQREGDDFWDIAPVLRWTVQTSSQVVRDGASSNQVAAMEVLTRGTPWGSAVVTEVNETDREGGGRSCALQRVIHSGTATASDAGRLTDRDDHNVLQMTPSHNRDSVGVKSESRYWDERLARFRSKAY